MKDWFQKHLISAYIPDWPNIKTLHLPHVFVHLNRLVQAISTGVRCTSRVHFCAHASSLFHHGIDYFSICSYGTNSQRCIEKWNLWPLWYSRYCLLGPCWDQSRMGPIRGLPQYPWFFADVCKSGPGSSGPIKRVVLLNKKIFTH